MHDLTPLATLTQEDLAAVWSLCPAGCIWVWSLPGMARLEEGAECEGGRPIASSYLLAQHLATLSISSAPSLLVCSFSLFLSFLLPLAPPCLHRFLSGSLTLSLPLAPWVSPSLLPEPHIPQALLLLGVGAPPLQEGLGPGRYGDFLATKTKAVG